MEIWFGFFIGEVKVVFRFGLFLDWELWFMDWWWVGACILDL